MGIEGSVGDMTVYASVDENGDDLIVLDVYGYEGEVASFPNDLYGVAGGQAFPLQYVHPRRGVVGSDYCGVSCSHYWASLVGRFSIAGLSR